MQIHISIMVFLIVSLCSLQLFFVMLISVCLFISLLLLVKHGFGDDVFTNRFAEIRFTPTFIDKTPLIYKVLKKKFLFINAPFMFGTSTNIGMLNFFLSNLRTKETLTEYFNGTEIWTEQSFVSEHLGAHPVILFNASNCGIVYNEAHMKVTFAWLLYNAYIDHNYLLKSSNISESDKQLLGYFMDRKQIQCLEIETILNGLRFLAQLLHEHFDKQVILLIDGLGRGVIERLIDDNNDFRYLSPLVVEWYNAMINNTLININVISYAVASSESRLYGLEEKTNSLFEKVSFMQKEEFSPYYGFTLDELEYLLCKYNIPMVVRPKLAKWYCGYSTVDGKVKVCNPHSVLSYLNSPKKIIKVYWTGSPVATDLIQRIVQIESYSEQIHKLVFKNPINITLAGETTDSVLSLRKKLELLLPDSEGFIYQVLIETGYLTFCGEHSSGAVEVKFPNEEVRTMIDKFVSLLTFV